MPSEKRFKTERVINEIENNLRIHKAEYLNESAVANYQAAVSLLQVNHRQNIGARRILQEAFSEKYGVSVLVAINIMDGFHVRDYLKMYENLKICDDMKIFLLEQLKDMKLPPELEGKQIDRLMDAFSDDSKRKELLKIYKADD